MCLSVPHEYRYPFCVLILKIGTMPVLNIRILWYCVVCWEIQHISNRMTTVDSNEHSIDHISLWLPVTSITLMFNVSWRKMFPALLTAVCVALVNMSRSIRTSVPSILSSATALMPTSELLCAEGNSLSWILLPQPVSVKSLGSVEREFHNHINFVRANHAMCKYCCIVTVTWFRSWPEQQFYVPCWTVSIWFSEDMLWNIISPTWI